MKDWFFSKDAIIAAVLFFLVAVLYLFLGVRKHNSFDYILAALALLVGIVNFVRYLKKK